MKTIPYGRQNITEEDIDAVVRVLRSEYLTQGPTIAEFETAFCRAIGARFGVAVANGTAALHIAALALNVKPGCRVLTTPITFAASANCLRYCGAEVEFIDIDPGTRCLDLSLLEARLESMPQGYYDGVVPVDYAGYPLDLPRLRELADRFGLWVLEDACHAVGSWITAPDGTRIHSGEASCTELACFSFHPVKHITTGEGGMVTTSSEAIYQRLLRLRSHGITRVPGDLRENHGGWYYEMQELGYNYRLTDMQAALGLSQLQRLGESNNRRQQIADRYDQAFKALPMTLPPRPSHGYHSFHLYVIETDRRSELYDFLRGRGILTQVHYIPVNHMPYYRSLGYCPEQTPRALHFYHRALSLPIFPTLSDDEQSFVIQSMQEFYQ